MERGTLFAYVKEAYGVDPDSPWENSPTNQVLRHSDTGKWFGLVMEVDRPKLGLAGEGKVDVINLKFDPDALHDFTKHPAITPAYHMSKTHWISVVLNDATIESLPDEKIFELIGVSFALTK